VVQVPGEIARKLFYEVPAVAEAMMRHLTTAIRRMSDLRALQAMPNAYQRVYALLAYLKETSPDGTQLINDMPTHQEIAIMVNTSRETATRAFARLKSIEVIRKDRRRLFIAKPGVLQKLIEHPSMEPEQE
jgi:CRP-like cAMP-binding protein